MQVLITLNKWAFLWFALNYLRIELIIFMKGLYYLNVIKYGKFLKFIIKTLKDKYPNS